MSRTYSSPRGDVIAIRCPRCGSPLEITPESLLVVCKYCGYPIWTRQAVSQPVLVVPAVRELVSRFFQRYVQSDPDMRGIAKKLKLTSAETIYVPVYLVDGHAWSKYEGVGTVTMAEYRRVKRGKETETQVIYHSVPVRVSGTHEGDYDADIVARRGVDASIVEPLIEYYRQARKGEQVEGGRRPEARPLVEMDWQSIRGEVLSAEIAPDKAEELGRDAVCDKHKEATLKKMEREAKAKAKMKHPSWQPVSVSWSSLKVNCEVRKLEVSPITLLPYVTVYYDYGGKKYRALFTGWDGYRIYGEEPLKPWQRALDYAKAVASNSIISYIGAIIVWHSARAGSVLGDVIGALIIGLGGIFGVYYLKRSLRDVRIEKFKRKQSLLKRLLSIEPEEEVENYLSRVVREALFED